MLPPYAKLIFNILSEDTIVLAIAIWESAKTDTHLYYSTTQKNRLLIKIEPLREAPFNIPRQITSMWNNLALSEETAQSPWDKFAQQHLQ